MNKVKFKTVLSSFGNNTGIEIPTDELEKLNAGKRPSLIITVNDYSYQTTPGIMKGKILASFSAKNREESGIKGGDEIYVELSVADKPREVEMSDEFLKALRENNVETFFNSLSNSIQRYHCDLINSAKSEDTKNNRITKAIELFKQGKKR